MLGGNGGGCGVMGLRMNLSRFVFFGRKKASPLQQPWKTGGRFRSRVVSCVF